MCRIFRCPDFLYLFVSPWKAISKAGRSFPSDQDATGVGFCRGLHDRPWLRMKPALLALALMVLLAPKSAAAGGEILAGTVLSAEPAGAYTIIRIEQGGKELWLAANSIVVEKGDRVEYMGGVVMKDFYIKSLDRTFPEILFLSNIRIEIAEEEMAAAEDAEAEAVSVEETAAAMPDDENHKNIGAGPQLAAPTAEEMAGLAAELTIAELFARGDSLADQVVRVKGKVMKVSRNILGRTWVTLSDGTGTAPDDVLRVTTLDEVKIGETVSAAGTVKINVDLGAGYKYKVIIDEAIFTR